MQLPLLVETDCKNVRMNEMLVIINFFFLYTNQVSIGNEEVIRKKEK